MVIKTRNCECCGKLIKLSEVKKYQPRKTSRIILLCDECYEDFVKIDTVIEMIRDNKNKKL